MSDKYIQIASFKYGLDTRREELVSQPGVLSTAENCHVNAGGELVKRKAFVADTVLFPPNTFGLQDTDEGLMTFGSIALASVGTLPTGVTYQRLLPDFLNNPDFETVTLAGDAVVNGTYTHNGTFNGKPLYGDMATKWAAWYLGAPGSPGQWQFRAIVSGSETIFYVSIDDVDRVDQVTTWIPEFGTDPKPTVVHTAAAGLAQMEEVIYSCNFLGKAFVIARFGSADFGSGTHEFVFCFYDGEVVPSSRNGLVLIDSGGNVEDSSDLSIDLAAQVDLIPGWNGIANTDVANPVTVPDTTPATPGSTIIESPPGISFEPVILNEDDEPLWDSTAGVMTRRLSDSLKDGTGEVKAKIAFTLSAGTNGSCDVKAPYVVDGTGVATISGGPINYLTSLAVTAGLIVDAINAKTSLTGYTAILSGTTITVVAPEGFGNFTHDLTVVTTLTLTAVSGSVAPGSLSMTLKPSVIFAMFNWDGGNAPGATVNHFAYCSVNVANKTGTVGYAWVETDPSGDVLMPNSSGISINKPTSSSVSFKATLIKGQSKTGYWKCTVTDAITSRSAVLQVTIGIK